MSNVVHVVFKDNEPNVEYNYVAGPKKEIIVMGPNAFTNHLVFLQSTVGTLLDTAEYLKMRIASLTALVEGGGPRSEQSGFELQETQKQLTETRTKIDALKAHFVTVRKEWSKAKDRIIGHVVWAPPISVATPPHQYTQDVCVIKFDKDKFRHFRRNVLSLGPEISPANFKKLMHDRFDAPREFIYPLEGLFKLRGTLTQEETHAQQQDSTKGSHPPRDKTWLHHAHHRNIDSVEAVIHPHNNDSGPTSRGGDSESVIVDAFGRFVAMLTGGTGKTDSSDITFGTPIHWLWLLISAKFDDDDDDN